MLVFYIGYLISSAMVVFLKQFKHTLISFFLPQLWNFEKKRNKKKVFILLPIQYTCGIHWWIVDVSSTGDRTSTCVALLQWQIWTKKTKNHYPRVFVTMLLIKKKHKCLLAARICIVSPFDHVLPGFTKQKWLHKWIEIKLWTMSWTYMWLAVLDCFGVVLSQTYIFSVSVGVMSSIIPLTII